MEDTQQRRLINKTSPSTPEWTGRTSGVAVMEIWMKVSVFLANTKKSRFNKDQEENQYFNVGASVVLSGQA